MASNNRFDAEFILEELCFVGAADKHLEGKVFRVLVVEEPPQNGAANVT